MVRSIHAGRLERWLGSEQLENLSAQMKEWYGPPVPVVNVPGRVFVTRGGDFVGSLKGGFFANLTEYYVDRLRRATKIAALRQLRTANAGFTSLSDLISEATTGGKIQSRHFLKVGAATANTSNFSLWTSAGYPTGAATGTATSIPNGDAPTRATTGAYGQTNPSGTDTLHLTTVVSTATTGPNTLVMYDRLFQAGSVSHGTTSSQAVTGIPARYNSTGSNATGNFVFHEVTTTLGATAHNITLGYTDSEGNAGTSVATAAVVSSTATRIPHALFFIPLAAGDLGFNQVNTITCSAVSTGSSNIVLGRALCIIPQPVANQGVVIDGINSCFNLVQVFSDACIAFMELKGVASASTYHGLITMVSG